MNSKQIGGTYERTIAFRLSKWLSGSTDKLICWRNTHSGNIGTIRKKKGLSGDNVSGDFQCLDSKYEDFFNLFHCDSKSLGDVSLMLINPNGMKSSQLFSNWRKVCEDAGESKIPLMFVKARNDRKVPDFVIIPLGVDISYENGIEYHVEYEGKEYDFSLILQEEFFRIINPESFLQRNLTFFDSI